MTTEKNDLALTEEIRKLLDGNRKFLDRIMDDDFESEEEPATEGQFEEL